MMSKSHHPGAAHMEPRSPHTEAAPESAKVPVETRRQAWTRVFLADSSGAASLSHQRAPRCLRSFTLVELVVAMGVIVVIASLTLVAVRQVARNSRQASGVNAVMASLDNARALAMKENKIVLVVYRPRFDGPNEMYVEAVLAEWTGQTAFITAGCAGFANPTIVDRFVPVQNITPRRLPRGIKVASPLYGSGVDENLNPTANTQIWATQPNLPTINQEDGIGEPPGALIGVMYGPDGATVSRNSQTDSHRIFVDFNNDFAQRLHGFDYDYFGSTPPCNPNIHFQQIYEVDEPMVEITPFLAVYDDDEARSLRAGDWTDFNQYTRDLTGPFVQNLNNIAYIDQRADRIHFNRYTGVAMK
jgi:type II secretory pathway pseudopilin PulG